MVPLRSAATRLGRPALISDCAPMIDLVRPAQFTITAVAGSGASCPHPQRELRPRHAGGGRDAHRGVLVEPPCVDHDRGRRAVTAGRPALARRAAQQRGDLPGGQQGRARQPPPTSSPNALLGALTSLSSSPPTPPSRQGRRRAARRHGNRAGPAARRPIPRRRRCRTRRHTPRRRTPRWGHRVPAAAQWRGPPAARAGTTRRTAGAPARTGSRPRMSSSAISPLGQQRPPDRRPRSGGIGRHAG